MNKAKLKELCIDALSKAEKNAFDLTKEYYILKVSENMRGAFTTIINPDAAHAEHYNKLSESLHEILEESFHEMLEKQNDNQSSA